MHNCYLCGQSATKPLTLKDSFTAHSICKVPESDRMCDRCAWVIPLRCWYFNPNKNKWGKLFSRNWSWLFQGQLLLAPIIEGNHTEGKDTLPIVCRLPTRADVRGWLIDPPEPPFTIAIAESGQKHIVPWAQEGLNRDRFPVQFELDSVWINRSEFSSIIGNYEALMSLGFSKTEIDSGKYRSEKLMKCLDTWHPLENQIVPYRGSRFLELISYLAQQPIGYSCPGISGGE